MRVVCSILYTKELISYYLISKTVIIVNIRKLVFKNFLRI
jgi:hypothetical protein